MYLLLFVYVYVSVCMHMYGYVCFYMWRTELNALHLIF